MIFNLLSAYMSFDIFSVYSFICFILPGSVWLFLNRQKIAHKRYRQRHIIWIYIYMLYCYLTVKKVAGIGTIWDLISHGKLDSTINLIPFSSEGFATYILNIIMFMPLGFLLPLIWRRYREMGRTVLTGFCMSLSIELSQLFCLRVTDIDDLTMNTLGTAIGFGCWIAFRCLFPKAGRKAIKVSSAEPLVYLFGGILGIILLYNWRIFG